MIEARIVEDSISPAGVRLTTLVVKYPRIVLAELNTHRALSRNTASSRAIPVAKIIQRVKEDPFIPSYWGANQPGMQAHTQIEDPEEAVKWWLESRDLAVIQAEKGLELGLHKQLANRILEPYMYIESVVTATDWDNFFALRIHPDAQPEIKELAERMLEAMNAHTPRLIEWGDLHLPFVTQEERENDFSDNLLAFSTARCARVSYLNHDGSDPNVEKDLKLYNQLLESKHMSPFEHQAVAHPRNTRFGNFYGWMQHRNMIRGENITNYPELIKDFN